MNIYDTALRRLEHRSRTVWELKQYLKEKEFRQEKIDEVIEEFLDCGYLNDYRYCHEYFRYAFGKGKGKMRVFTELKQKGVDPALVAKAFDEWDEKIDEREIAMKEVRKILAAAGIEEGDEIPEKVMGRIGRRLSYKGFPAGVVYSIIGDLKR